jgi:Na+-transporting NADH:ubiquinone oxidoreductase subunit E
MTEASWITIFVAAIFTHNVALTYLLGMCPFVALSRSLKTAFGMGVAVVFVITLTATANWVIYTFVLVPLKSEIITYVVFIIVIAASVQLVEMIMERFFPALQAAFGIFLPLITVNCTVLAVSLFTMLRQYSFIQTLFFSAGSAAGYWLAIVIVAAIYERLVLISDIPKGLRGPGIIIIITGIIALAFMGFSGMVSIS